MTIEEEVAPRAASGTALHSIVFGATTCLVCAVADVPAHAQVKETVLHTFVGGADGANPEAPILADSTGPNGALRSLYGTTSSGGVQQSCAFSTGCGTVFKLTPPKAGHRAWKDSILSLFPSMGNVGAVPAFAGLSARTKRISLKTPVYGTTYEGGSDGNNGTVFSLTGTTVTTIYSFTAGLDGAGPADPTVVFDEKGALYVSAQFYGGASGCGTVVKLAPPGTGQTKWTETTLWTFTGGSDGCYPVGLTIDKSGSLFGAAQYGGNAANDGTIFKLTPPAKGQSVWTEQTLWQFQGGTDGTQPNALTAGKNGEIYGTTYSGGGEGCNRTGCGIVFELLPPSENNTAWTEQVLWKLSPNSGTNPTAQLIEDRNGVLFGTASSGGLYDQGTVFRLTPPQEDQAGWTEATLLHFRAGTDSGGEPMAALTADGEGILYGTTITGGSGNGVVFSLTGTGFVP